MPSQKLPSEKLPSERSSKTAPVRRGAPLKLTPERTAKMCALVREDAMIPVSVIAEAVGIDRHTIAEWVKLGTADDAPEELAKFAEAWLTAKAEGEIAALRKLQSIALDSGGTDPASFRWMLSKRNPKVFGDKVHTEVTGAEGGALKIDGLADLLALGFGETAPR